MNKLLLRQLKRYLGKAYSIPKEWDNLFGKISEAYDQFDADRKLIERSFDLSSQELVRINQEIKQNAEELQRRKDQIIRQQAEIVKLASEDIIDMDSALKRITEGSSKTLKTERVSVWFYNMDHSKIICKDLYELTKNKHEKGTSLMVEDYPKYFDALEKERIIAANNASADSRTKEFTERYNSVHGITSMMDVPIRLRGKIIGIVCHEHTGFPREWTQEEQVFAGSIADMVSLVMEASELKQAEKALADEKERLAVTLKSIGDGVITTDTEGYVFLMNRVAEKLTGWKQENATGKPLPNIFKIINEQTREPCTNPVEKVMKTGDMTELANNTILIAKDGKEKIIANSGAPIRDKDSKIIGVILVFRDITESRKREREHLKAQKIESIGLLAGGIAHDFNNILNLILGNISIAKVAYQNKSKDVKIEEILTNTAKAVHRASGLTQQLLTFSKGGSPVKKTSDITELVKETISFTLKGSASKCKFEIPGKLYTLEIDEDQINQVIHNLAINADQAMPEGGVIEVRMENITVGVNNPLSLQPGPYVRISIKDNGTGITPDNLDKIFDLYFSTKERGTGLGLSVSHSIIRNHDGFINVDSSLGKGSTFHIYLPASEKPLVIEKKKEGIVEGTSRVLVMDDEELLRELLEAMLETLGYQTELTENGQEALEKYKEAKQSGQDFDAVILDLTIPGGMGGKETIQELKKIDPNVKAIVTSGYSNDPILANFREYGFVDILKKPYETESLSTILQNLFKTRS